MLIKHIYGKGLNFDLQLRGVIEELGHVRNVVRLVFSFLQPIFRIIMVNMKV